MGAGLNPYRTAAGLGLIGGVVVVYLALVGIIEDFAERPVITDFVTLGIVAPAIALLILAYRATAAPPDWQGSPPTPLNTVGRGVVAGLAGGLLTAAFVALITTVDITFMFVNATPTVTEILSLGLTPPALGPIVLGLGLGLTAGLLRLVPRPVRGPLIIGFVVDSPREPDGAVHARAARAARARHDRGVLLPGWRTDRGRCSGRLRRDVRDRTDSLVPGQADRRGRRSLHRGA